MMKTTISITFLAAILFLFPKEESSQSFKPETKVADVMYRLGDTIAARNKPDTNIAGVSVDAGKRLVETGTAEKPGGGTSARISKHFVCTSCHNTQREDPKLTQVDPDARLEYAVQNDLPFLPATTFFGISNRETYYNGDYLEKYGEELVGEARHSLRASIQLCATECSSGRYLKPWELESIVSYFWSIGYEMNDLNWEAGDRLLIKKALEGEDLASEAMDVIRSKYMSHSPATFIDPPDNRSRGNTVKANAQKGKQIFIRSCMHCHENERYSMFRLDTSKYSLRFLEKHIPTYESESIYQVIRYGTSPIYGKRAYMPLYPIQKMSRRQIEHLRAYIERGPDLSS